METGSGDIDNIRVTYEKMERDKIEYSSHTLAEVAYGEKGMTGSWLQGPGLVSKQTRKKIIQGWIINNLVLPSIIKIYVVCKRISSE